MTKSLLFAVILMTAALSFTQATPSQQKTIASPIVAYTQTDTALTEAIPPYEMTFTVEELFFGPGFSITLEKGQDLIIHISNPDNIWHNAGKFSENRGCMGGLYIANCDNNIAIHTHSRARADISCKMMGINWGGYYNLFRQRDPLSLDEKLDEDGSVLSYYFKNNHEGKEQLQFHFHWIPAGNSSRDSFNAEVASGVADSRIINVTVQ